MANKRISELTSITGANLADADLLVVVDVSDTTMASSGTNKKVTLNEFAQDSAFSSRYAPLADTVWVPAQAMSATQGSPTLGKIGNLDLSPAWLLDSATVETVGSSVALPPWWLTWHADVWLTNADVNAGNARLQFYYSELADGSTLDNIGYSVGTAYTMPAKNVIDVIRMTTTAQSYVDGMINFMLQRQGDDVTDTLGNDIGLVGIQFVRAS